MKKLLLSISIFLTSLLNLKAQDVPFSQRLTPGGLTVRGDITFLSNNILNRQDSSFSPNDSFNGNGGNGQLNIQYIDIDNDPTTFSSSSSTLNLPACSKIVHAGLYWSAIYAYETWSGEEARAGDYKNIKFKLPGQSYKDVTSDEVIYDAGIITQRPYLCYKDMTSIVSALPNPNGDYFAANIRGTTGKDNKNGTGGVGGWILVVIYENSNESEKHISLYDGFSTVDGTNTTDIKFSGVKTPQNGTVKVKALVAALEGDQTITGDRFQIKGTNGTYSTVFDQKNSEDNFFNSSITQYNKNVTSRNPASTNTLGFDVDLFEINNQSNNLITNNQNAIETRFTTSGDVYWPFLNAITTEIAEAKPLTIKSVNITSTGNLASGRIVVKSEGGIAGYKYSINDGEFKSSNSFFDLEAGSYKIQVQDANGCIADAKTVTVDKIGIDNSVSQASKVLKVSYKNAVSYQWIDVDSGEAISGANQPTYQPTKSGRYQVEMVVNQTSTKVVNKTTINRNSTKIVLSPVIVFKSGVLSVNDVEEKIVKLYPNPASERLILPKKLINKRYKIYSIIGKQLRYDKVSSEVIHINEFSRGVYFLKIEGYKPVRFVKK